MWQAEVEPWRLLARTWRNRETNGEPRYIVDTDGLLIEEFVAPDARDAESRPPMIGNRLSKTVSDPGMIFWWS